ncbi:phosphoribosylformylglycinamidine cyclo-ligase [Neisseriaceae bacterium PsAf]|nr:phosphoribosylformylglycinamidine cyclo-ligase [Neisseriaceae bacterium PsAf]
MSKPLNYKSAGVDIEAGDRFIENIKPFAKNTMRPEVLTGLGGFGALFEIGQNYKNPVLVSGTDGVGTKLKLAFQWDIHDTIGIDLVAMSVNDILVQGAEPLFFLDYFACGQLNVEQATKAIKGIAKGCELSNCALIGGETAEMPGMYAQGEYDLAGFSVGIVEKDQIINGQNIKESDIVLGLGSSGAHSNGYSLIRKILNQENPNLDEPFDAGKSLKEIILTPTRIYVRSILKAINEVTIKGMAHITGGGLLENIPRILPENTQVVLQQDNWKIPKLFTWLQNAGNIEMQELYRTFNCGIGMVLIIDQSQAAKTIEILQNLGETVFTLGEVKSRKDNEPQIQII